MKTNLLTLILCIYSVLVSSQIDYKEIQSEILGTSRQLKIQLPRNYDENIEKSYPVIVVMDGDYLFEPVAGNVDYYSYWEEMPQVIVVGINQVDSRDDDTFYDDVSNLPSDTGASFFEFLGLEVMPYLDENYRTSTFRIAVGHDMTANFMNYYLMKDPALFQGYISLSPDLAPQMEERLVARLGQAKQKIFYYLATASDDISVLRDPIIQLDAQMKQVQNENVQYNFDNFDGATHYSLVGRAIPKALENMFSIYRPISKKEYKEKILPSESPYNYLIDKYATVKTLFGLDDPIRINDFIATSTALEKKGDWEGLEELGKVARKQYPETMLGNYYLALSLEKSGEPKKAMRAYQNAFLLEEVSFLTKDLMLDRADQIKQDFGY
ncbi:alpha/beta hydrolase [Dokdonia sp. Asnod3-C12]|uniref:alpha/beta hydrolase n=1 Tax=Dokdonia sp. Asnod3-C12 TaxID=3160575 RepID=UPI00386FC3E5